MKAFVTLKKYKNPPKKKIKCSNIFDQFECKSIRNSMVYMLNGTKVGAFLFNNYRKPTQTLVFNFFFSDNSLSFKTQCPLIQVTGRYRSVNKM